MKLQKNQTIPASSNEKNMICETKNFRILLTFLLITIELLITASVYCHLTKYKAK